MLKIKIYLSILVCSLCLCLPQSLFAQDELDVEVDEEGRVLLAPRVVDISESYIGLSFGLSMPSENFANTLPAEESGFAKTGIKASLDGAFIFFRNMGLGYTFNFSKNGIDEASYLNKIKYHLPNGNVNGSFNRKSWISSGLSIGPYISLPERNFMFDFGFLVGLTYAVTPEVIYNGTFDDQSVKTHFRRDGSISPNMDIFIGVNRHLSKDLRVYLKGEMFFSRPEFRELTEITAETFQIESSDDHKQSVSYIAFNVGIAYELGNDKKIEAKRKSYKSKFRRMNWLIKKGKDK